MGNMTNETDEMKKSMAPPPPPPPPPPPMLLKSAVVSQSSHEVLFAALNQGLDITKTLTKVTPDMQTHKNAELRASAPLDAKSVPSTNGKHSAPNAKAAPEPVLLLVDGKTWKVDYQRGSNKMDKKMLEVNVESNTQFVRIFKCENAVVIVKGKANAVSIDMCKNTDVAVDALVSQIEINNCKGIIVQTFGHVPMINIQKTDGCSIYLSKDSVDTEFTTSKSSEMNISVPAKEDGDFVEYAVPEQFNTVIKEGKLVTTVSDV